MCQNNYNLVWAWPTHLIFAFFIGSAKPWVQGYKKLAILGLMLAMLSWLFVPQQLHPVFLALAALLQYRLIRLLK
jgi:hypothetical protein